MLVTTQTFFPRCQLHIYMSEKPGGLGIGTPRPRGLCSVRAKRTSPSLSCCRSFTKLWTVLLLLSSLNFPPLLGLCEPHWCYRGLLAMDDNRENDGTSSEPVTWCYWFTSTICDIVEKEYECITVNDNRHNIIEDLIPRTVHQSRDGLF